MAPGQCVCAPKRVLPSSDEVAGEASTEATGELVTRAHFDTALAQLKSRLAWHLVTAGIAIAAVVVPALRFLG